MKFCDCVLKRKINQKKTIAEIMISLDRLQAFPQSKDGSTSKLYFHSIFSLQIPWLFVEGNMQKYCSLHGLEMGERFCQGYRDCTRHSQGLSCLPDLAHMFRSKTIHLPVSVRTEWEESSGCLLEKLFCISWHPSVHLHEGSWRGKVKARLQQT